VAEIVAGIGTAHSPQLCMPPRDWGPHGQTFDVGSGRLAGLTPTRRTKDELEAELADEVMAARYARCQVAMDHLYDRLRALEPDVVVIVGDDEKELFRDEIIPACCVFTGDELHDLPVGSDKFPATMKEAYQYYHAPSPERYETVGRLGRHIVEQMNADDIDVARSSVQPEDRSLGHAFTFIRRRIFQQDVVPIVPFFLNTYYPPNQPTPGRCVDLGRSLRRAIDSWDSDQRVVVVASGGLSHPIIDESLDQTVLRALASNRFDTLSGLDVSALVEGSSEIRNWILVGAALTGFTMQLIDYIPAYRSILGSGCGMAFAEWAPGAA
jgi:3-O-methylgallate 3,4-dioxygenase